MCVCARMCECLSYLCTLISFDTGCNGIKVTFLLHQYRRYPSLSAYINYSATSSCLKVGLYSW